MMNKNKYFFHLFHWCFQTFNFKYSLHLFDNYFSGLEGCGGKEETAERDGMQLAPDLQDHYLSKIIFMSTVA